MPLTPREIDKLMVLSLAACGTPKGESGVFNIMDYGAVGDGQTDDAAAIQSAINACNKAGGGQVLVPAGHTFLCSPFKLASYVDLHLEANARLLANPNEKVYKESAFRDNRGAAFITFAHQSLGNFRPGTLQRNIMLTAACFLKHIL